LREDSPQVAKSENRETLRPLLGRKPAGHVGKRSVADVLIEAFAQRSQGLITRNAKHFSAVAVVTP
jgi:predicted nucleic acid-binding protein